MIINNTTVKIDSNVEPTKSLNFGISDVRLVVDILSKLYAYPIRTLVQEYICNGRDAMREAGTWNKMPMDITVPTTLDPVFKVRDYGVGITPDRMENIFVNYGSSTKRGTNAQTGGFGIGAKSAFSYTDSFTITSFVNGTKYIYVAHLADDGGVNLISKSATTEANGVEISIGVKPKDIRDFHEAVQRCVKFWAEPIKFIGTKSILQFKPTLNLVCMSVYDSDSLLDSGTIFLIDGIQYDLMQESHSNYWTRTNNDLSHKSVVAINVANGHFKIASSRERLESNDDNMAKQKALLNQCNIAIDTILASKINNVSLKLTDRINNKTLYSGFTKIAKVKLDLGDNFSISDDTVYTPKAIFYRYRKQTRRGKTSYEIDNRTTFSTNSTVIYSTTEPDNITARKLNYYLETTSNTATLVNEDDIASMPHNKLIFTDRIKVSDLPLPPKKSTQRTQKSTRDAICWLIESNGTRSQWTVEKLNNSINPVVFVDQTSPEIIELSGYLTVISVPKCNKDIVLKKGMTVDQGKKYLLSKNKEDVVGLENLPHDWQKVEVLKKFKKKKSPDTLQRYLFANFPALKSEHDAMKSEFNELVRKYPLITVLNSLGHFSNNSSQIVINEINKQSKEG